MSSHKLARIVKGPDIPGICCGIPVSSITVTFLTLDTSTCNLVYAS